MWYWSFVIRLGWIDDVNRLLAYDLWSMHLNPGQHVRTITVGIVPYYKPYIEKSLEEKFLMVANFARLLELQVPVKLTISLELRKWQKTLLDDEQAMKFTELVEKMVFPSLEQMLMTGLRVMVQVEGL
jgi:hypothetical protein